MLPILSLPSLDDNKDKLTACLAGYWYLKCRQRRKRFWVNSYFAARPKLSEFYTSYPLLRQCKDQFFENYRMSVEQFDYLLKRIEGRLQKQVTTFREPISPELSLVLTLK